ncbi:MAG TPA: hypothetical protein PKD86_03315 [Gemmatales bacterium]|nr:hypothetical protein [Gemmatales bacterium]HMP58363.1 hypothetical protein [Gemmatales bacterium]
MIDRVTRWRLLGLVLGLAVLAGMGLRADAAHRSHSDSWLPDAMFTRMFDESLKTINEFARSESSLNQKANDLESEAYYLIMLAEVARQNGMNEWGKRAVVLQAHAAELALAARRKDLEAAKKFAGLIAELRSADSVADAKANPLAQAVPIQNLMKQVQTHYKRHQEFRRLSAAAFGQRGKPEEIQSAAFRMAVYSLAIHAHVPTKDIPKDKSAKDWEEACDDMRKACLDVAAAARAKKQADVKSAILRMEASCNRCHRDFRVDID